MPHSRAPASAAPRPGGPSARARRSTVWPCRCRWRQNAAMKWWGWGDEGVAFTHDDKPDLGPFIKRAIDLDVDAPGARPVAFEELDVPEPMLDADLRAA